MSTIKLAAARWAMEIRPDRGGRITSLRLDGEELLDQGIGVDQPTAEGFVEGGAFGWDEMVPNLEPTDVLPDHGEAWRLPWDVLRQRSDEVLMQCRGTVVPWELARMIRLHEDRVEVFYMYENVGKEAHNAYWRAHPLFRYEPDMVLSAGVPRPPEGKCAKVFLPPGSPGRFRVGRVELRWDARALADVAVWVCNGDLGGYRQIAVEPCWMEPGLEPGEMYDWQLQIVALD